MKKISIYIALLLSVVLIVSCKKSFLNAPPLGELSKDQLAEKSGVETVLHLMMLTKVVVVRATKTISTRWKFLL